MKTVMLEDGDIVLNTGKPVLLADAEALKQRAENRLRLFLGEFSLSPESGVDWFSITAKKYPEKDIEKAVRKELLKDTEILSVDSVLIESADTSEKAAILNIPLRTAKVSYYCRTVYGELRGSL
ncbi:MAG TPA: hypothetical protein PL048_20095 [Leptospiraceae bacterium]|nr:hypothetical protein [Leptospiraceae bacterium]HNM06751.1 hypothetical protein [Leptospiraceae bacterium]